MDRTDAQFLIQAGAAWGISLDSEAVARIGRFLDLLLVWNRRIRLTGDQDPQVLLRKHVVDCLPPVALLPSTGLVVDIGAGGGFPGLVLGCARPDLELLLVEPRRKPRNFLAEAVRVIPLPKARALEARAEELPADQGVQAGAAVVVSRALRMDVFVSLAAPILGPDGIAVSMQTPAVTEPRASAIGAKVGLVVRACRDYVLPDGEHRRLILFARR